MEKNELLMIKGTQYQKMTISLLEAAHLDEIIGDRKKYIGIKPNLVSPSPASEGATTHPEVVCGLIEYLHGHGFTNLALLEGSWVGSRTMDSFRTAGYEGICREYDVPFIDMQKEKGISIDCAGMSIPVGKAALDIEFLINVPVLKGHCQTRMTCALKNMKGLLTNPEKRHFHAMGLHKPIAHLNAGLHQDFILVDNICGDLTFEDGGNPVVMNRLIAGLDPVLVDAFACKVLGLRPQEVPYVTMASELGVGQCDLSRAKISYVGGEALEEIKVEQRIVSAKDAVEEVESCSACYGYLIPVLDKLSKELGEAVSLEEALGTKICIGQGYRGQEGELGIGSCTRGFACSLPGCPPMPEEMEAFLRERIRSKGFSI